MLCLKWFSFIKVGSILLVVDQLYLCIHISVLVCEYFCSIEYVNALKFPYDSYHFKAIQKVTQWDKESWIISIINNYINFLCKKSNKHFCTWNESERSTFLSVSSCLRSIFQREKSGLLTLLSQEVFQIFPKDFPVLKIRSSPCSELSLVF